MQEEKLKEQLDFYQREYENICDWLNRKYNAVYEEYKSSQLDAVVKPATCENCEELKQLFELEHKRMMEADKYWQEKTGRHDTFPDLGKLLKFLMDKIIEFESKLSV